MPLSINNAIVADEIERVKILKSNSVYLLKGFDNDKVVIKREYTEAAVIKSAKSIATTIDPRAKLKILAPGEMAALNTFITGFEQTARDYDLLGMPFDDAEKKAVHDLKYCMGNVRSLAGNLLKMDPVEVTDLWTALEERLDPNVGKADLRSFTAALNAPGGLEKLGQLIAVDLFNNNTDRFNPGQPSPITIGERNFEMRCLSSPQNVFRIRTDSGFEVGVLDYIPLTSPFRDINTPLAQIERQEGVQWPGRILADKNRRKEFAKDVVHDLEKLLNPNKSRFSLKSKLKGDPVSRIIAGMVHGAALIRDKLQLKYNPNRWTQGVTDRHAIMCKVQ